jgi:hypothetical protein
MQYTRHTPRGPGIQYARSLSTCSSEPLEYWIVRPGGKYAQGGG